MGQLNTKKESNSNSANKRIRRRRRKRRKHTHQPILLLSVNCATFNVFIRPTITTYNVLRISSSTITQDINISRLFYCRILSQFKWRLQSRIIFRYVHAIAAVDGCCCSPFMAQFLCIFRNRKLIVAHS